MVEPRTLSDLVAAAAEGDRAAWNEIVERFSSLLWAVARGHRLSQDDAADVVQNTWMRLIDGLDTIRQPEALAGWLSTTARHESLSMLRRRGRDVPVRSDDLAPNIADPTALSLDAALLDSERDGRLWQCFAELSERCQRLLRVLMSVDRPNYAVVSSSLGLPIGSIGPTRMRCLTRLRALVDDCDYAFEGRGSRHE